MGQTLSADRNNAFDAVRLFLASLVVYTHAHLTGGFGPEGFTTLVRGQTVAGTLAVLGFFGISGYLVGRSYVKRRNWRAFLMARMLRIWPGLLLALVLTGFVFGPLISAFNPSSGGWSAAAAVNFFWENAFVQVRAWNVGGVLQGLPYQASINGALWSLWPEICCYGLVLFLGTAGLLRKPPVAVGFFAVLLFAVHIVAVVDPEAKPPLLPTLLALTHWTPLVMAFLTGALMASDEDVLGGGGGQPILWGVVTAILLRFGGWELLSPVVLPLFLITFSRSLTIRFSVDISYGMYVLHFPILQLMAAMGLQKAGFAAFFAAGYGITAVLAYASWVLVEKPALGLKRRWPGPLPEQAQRRGAAATTAGAGVTR